MTQMLAQREHDYFAETVICANCYIVAITYNYFLFFHSSWGLGSSSEESP